MTLRIRTYQSSAPSYRLPLFDRVARSSRCESFTLVTAEGTLAHDLEASLGFSVEVTPHWRRIGPMIWHPNWGLPARSNRPNVVVIEGNTRNIRSLELLARAKAAGIASVWWGIGFMPHQRRLTLQARLGAMRLADSVLAYTDVEAERLRQLGIRQPVVGLQNTVDEGPIRSYRAHWTAERLAEFRVSHALTSGALLLFVGRLDGKDRLDVLISALRELTDRNWQGELICVGDGRRRREYERMASCYGVANVRWLGEIRNEQDLAPWFLVADLFVYPGSAGLAVNQSMLYGLPVVTAGGRWRTAESMVIESGVNGWIYDGDRLDPTRLTHTIFTLTNDAELRNMLAVGAERSADHMRISVAADRFLNAASLALDRRVRP